jgi:hypothetical protein
VAEMTYIESCAEGWRWALALSGAFYLGAYALYVGVW